MNELHELRRRLCEELMSYNKKDMSAGSLDVIDKLAHAIKNIDKIIEASDGGEYSRGRGYSYHNDMVGELRSLMNRAPDDRTRREFQSFISRMESM